MAGAGMPRTLEPGGGRSHGGSLCLTADSAPRLRSAKRGEARREPESRKAASGATRAAFELGSLTKETVRGPLGGSLLLPATRAQIDARMGTNVEGEHATARRKGRRAAEARTRPRNRGEWAIARMSPRDGPLEPFRREHLAEHGETRVRLRFHQAVLGEESHGVVPAAAVGRRGLQVEFAAPDRSDIQLVARALASRKELDHESEQFVGARRTTSNVLLLSRRVIGRWRIGFLRRLAGGWPYEVLGRSPHGEAQRVDLQARRRRQGLDRGEPVERGRELPAARSQR